MAIDSMLFALSFASGDTLTKGEEYPFKVVRGPTVVRDGYGKAVMKRVFSASDSTSTLSHITIKNQNWIDSMANVISQASTISMGNNSPNVQRCGDIEVQPNTAFEVKLVIDTTTTLANSVDVFVLIDIDYPQVSAVANPKMETGAPVTLYEEYTINSTAIGNGTTPTWTSFNVDLFKAGFRYLLAEASARYYNASLGFFSISGAAGQDGLERIIPYFPTVGSLRYELDYSTALVKGPMNLNFMVLGASAGSDSVYLEMDFIRR